MSQLHSDITFQSTHEPFSNVGYVASISGSTLTGLLYSKNSGNNGMISAAEELQIGSLVKMKTTEADVYGFVEGLRTEDHRSADADDKLIAEIKLIGEVMHGSGDGPGTFIRGVSKYPGLRAPIYTTTCVELSLVYGPPRKASCRMESFSTAVSPSRPK